MERHRERFLRYDLCMELIFEVREAEEGGYPAVGDWVAPGDVIAAMSDANGAPPQLLRLLAEHPAVELSAARGA